MTQDKAAKVLSITVSVRSQILRQLTEKMTCGVNSVILAQSEVRTVRMPQI